MKGDPVPDGDNVVRHVGGSRIDGGIVLPEAFSGTSISVSWLEFHAGSEAERVAHVRSVLRLEIGKTAGLAQLEAAAVRGLNLDVLEAPLDAANGWPSWPCHAEIVGIAGDEERQKLIYEKLADMVVAIHPAHPAAGAVV